MSDQNKILLEGSLDEAGTRANLNKQLSALTKELQKSHKIKLDLELNDKTVLQSVQKSAAQQTKAFSASELVKFFSVLISGKKLIMELKENLDHQKVLKTA